MASMLLNDFLQVRSHRRVEIGAPDVLPACFFPPLGVEHDEVDAVSFELIFFVEQIAIRDVFQRPHDKVFGKLGEPTVRIRAFI